VHCVRMAIYVGPTYCLPIHRGGGSPYLPCEERGRGLATRDSCPGSTGCRAWCWLVIGHPPMQLTCGCWSWLGWRQSAQPPRHMQLSCGCRASFGLRQGHMQAKLWMPVMVWSATGRPPPPPHAAELWMPGMIWLVKRHPRPPPTCS
jgi:hypothetical protein